MLRNRIYYSLKPLIPAPLRLAIRRKWAARIRHRVHDRWPIMPGSERPPDNWIGWPDGRQFALLLTHDVEGPAGLDRCRRLMDLEMSHGIRSAFNFIPEGTYRVPRDLREDLARNGFEVGVHDLRHDGHLYRSRDHFRRNARQIEHYLKEWDAVGFRSGFMLNKLDWLHDLDIEYDASTFDTDPFEPQPEGRHTIFPFWVPRPAATDGSAPDGQRPGYVEIPYTLPQDSTLFVLLREPSPEIWLRKLDWIADHGGMAHINVHPDYIAFDDEPAGPRTYPVGHYLRFLDYVMAKHAGNYWLALPRDVAGFVRSSVTVRA